MGASVFGNVMLYVRTIARMKPSMILARLRCTRKVPNGLPSRTICSMGLAIKTLDCDRNYASRFKVDGLDSNSFSILNEQHIVDLSEWSVSEASHLWNFNLHYFEYCVPLAARYTESHNRDDLDQFKRLVLTWIMSCKYPHGDAWHPYTISLRLINWLVCLDLFGDALTEDAVFMDLFEKSMYRLYRHLLANQEKHLLANHYFENLKTLVICALLFGEDDVFAEVERDLLAQLDEQILADGVHYERSMMYHKLVLEGLLRVTLAYRASGKQVPDKVLFKAKQMLDAMASIERGMGKTPFFNDSADGVAKECDALVDACRNVLGYEADSSKTSFPESGFYKLYDGDASLVFFAGEPGPRYMLGHAHCDLLSFELSVAGEPVIINSGTYAYQSEFRPYFRSTAAHNTCQIDGSEQMECWGEHRVARGVRDVRVFLFGGDSIKAAYTDYRGISYERELLLTDGKLSVIDKAPGASASNLVSYLHLLSGRGFQLTTTFEHMQKKSEERIYSRAFGIAERCTVFSCSGLSHGVGYTFKWN